MANDSPLNLSANLSLIIRRHNARYYDLVWIGGMMRTHKNKEDSVRVIRERYNLVINSGLKVYGKEDKEGGIKRWRERLRVLIADLKALSHADFDTLQKLTVTECVSAPITTIKDRKINLSKED